MIRVVPADTVVITPVLLIVATAGVPDTHGLTTAGVPDPISIIGVPRQVAAGPLIDGRLFTVIVLVIVQPLLLV